MPSTKNASKSFGNAISRKMVILGNEISSAKSKEAEKYRDSAKLQIDISLSKVKVIPWYQGEMQIHHIVAQRAKGAEETRKKLYSLDLTTEIEENKALLTGGFHQRLHNYLYYKWIEVEIENVVIYGENVVKNKLNEIGIILTNWNQACLF